MFFEVAGFLFGMAGIGAVFWLLYRRETNRVLGAIQSGPAARHRG
jgi:hypothetical protein